MNKLILLLVLWIPYLALGQSDTIPTQELKPVEVTSLKLNTTLLKSPIAISKYEANEIQATKQQLSLQEYTNNIPGLFALNANNYAQDLRISIRGFGARAAFGIRGVKLIIDGIPETTPDGQGQVDNLNVGIVQNIEVIKGPASGLYGNASGGVISVNTLSEFSSNFIEAGLTFGAYNMQQYQLSGGIRNERTHFIFQGNYVRTDGYRAQSSLQSTNLNTKILHQFSDRSKLSVQVNYTNSPVADDPGGINLESVEEDRRQARDRNVLFKTGEDIQQFKIGLNHSLQLKNRDELNTYAFYSNRQFMGKLPFEFGGMIELNRQYMGQGIAYSRKQIMSNAINEFKIGYDIAFQRDDRQRFRNLEGEKGDQTLGQIESFTNAGLYLLDQLSFNKLTFTAGLRYDWNQLKAEDQFLSNGDGSGEIKLSAFNPSIGLSYEFIPLVNIYANYRSSFETPSLSELSEDPNGNTGFNTSLKSQEANNIELGIKALINQQLSIDLTWFHINTKNELVPFELEAFPDRNFFRNAGKTSRDGVELSANYNFNPQWSITSSYTFSNFVYKEYELPQGDFADNQLPGIPKHFGAFSINYVNEDGFNAQLQTRFIGEVYTRDANDIVDPSYALVNLSLGYRYQFKDYIITPFLGVNNLLNQKYNDNIRINAFGSRFYEPGPELNIYGGVRFRWAEKDK